MSYCGRSKTPKRKTYQKTKPLFDLEERVMATTKEQAFLATFKLWEREAILSWMYRQNNVMSTD